MENIEIIAMHAGIMPPPTNLFPPVDHDAAVSVSVCDNKPNVAWPSGYSLDDDGLWFDGGGEPEWISGPFKVLGETRNNASSGWGIALEWRDRDGVLHHEMVSRSDLIGGNDVIKTLVDGGLMLSTKPANLMRFREALNGVECNERVRLVDKTGWHGSAFVLPDKVIGKSSERLHYVGTRTGVRFAWAGSLDDWNRGVASSASGNPRLLLALSTAFSGPLFSMLNERPIGIHFRGGSSTGKTTLLIAAGSVWGGGGPNGFCGSWRATANGLEATAAAHSGTCLILDELAEIDAQEAGKAAYALINGTGKQRARQTGEARPRVEWCTPVLSSGEISLADKIAEDRGRQARVGVDVRIIDLEADAGKGFGVFEDLHDSSSAAEFADTLRHQALRSYGTAGPAFVGELAANFEDSKSTAAQTVGVVVKRMTVGVTEGQLLRVARRFAIIGVAGEMARVALGLDWEPNATVDAAVKLFADWKATRGDCAGEFTRALQAIRIAIDRHGHSRFEDRRRQDSPSSLPVRDRLGFRCTIQGRACWAFTTDGWREIVSPVSDSTFIGRQLHARGWVLTDSAGKWSVSYKVDGLATRVIAIPEENLERFDAVRETAQSCVTRVTGVTDEAVAGGFTGACREVPVVSWDAAAGGGHTVTQVTRLHKYDDRDDDAAMLERAAIVEHDGGLPREIADGLALLEGAPPPPGYSDTEWLDTVTAMALFVDQHGAEAIKLGWTAEDLFGVIPHAPAARCDKRGLASLLRKGDRVVMLTADAAVIERPSGSRTTFQRQAHGAQSVLAWNLDTAA